MRFIRCYTVIMRCPEISDGAKVLYSLLKAYVGKTSNRVWPSQETLAEQRGCSVRTIRRDLQELVKWEIVHEKWAQYESGPSNTYYLTDEKAAAKIARGERRRGGHQCPTQGGHGCPTKENHSRDALREDPSKYGT